MENLAYPFKVKPFAHQLEALTLSKDRQVFALFMEMGTGKSKVTIDNIAYLYDNGRLNGALIIAPKGVYRTWVNEQVPEHMPEHVKYYMAYWSAYKTKERLKTYEPLFQVSDDLHILVMNIEALSTSSGVEFARKFIACHHCMMVIDESTTIKNLKARRTKAALSLGKQAKGRRILTGMPVTQSPMDLYSQCAFLSPSLLGHGSYFTFRARYAMLKQMQMGARSFQKVVGYQRLDELTEILQTFSYRKTKEECLDLPPKLYQYREVELTDEQKQAYQQMKSLAMMQLDATTIVTAAMVMIKLEKLQEIVCGFIKDPVTGTVKELANNRVQEVLDILEETSGKVIIWAGFTHSIEMLYKELVKVYGAETVAHFYGGTGDELREETKRRFQDKQDPLRFMIVNPASGRFGMTLTEAKTMIYYSNSHNLEHRIQSEDRAHRIGQTDNLLIIDLITPATVDEKIIKNLRAKKNVSDAVMGEGYRTWLS